MYYVGISSDGNAGYDPDEAATSSLRRQHGILRSDDNLHSTAGRPGGYLPAPRPHFFFDASQTASAVQQIALPNTVDLYQIQLNTGDQVTATVNAHSLNSSLNAVVLRIFDRNGVQITMDDNSSGNDHAGYPGSQLHRCATTWASPSAGNNDYNPLFAKLQATARTQTTDGYRLLLNRGSRSLRRKRTECVGDRPQ